eukprot:5481648-Pleurochrysis_carterae.AAC.2
MMYGLAQNGQESADSASLRSAAAHSGASGCWLGYERRGQRHSRVLRQRLKDASSSVETSSNSNRSSAITKLTRSLKFAVTSN